MAELTFETTVAPFGPAAAIVLTDEQVAALGSTRTPPVVVTIGGASQRLRVARMGGENCIGLSKAARAALGVQSGDRVTATVALDAAERTVDVPDDLVAALDAAGVRPAFDALAYTTRKEHARGVTEAKRPETRARRVEKVVASLGG